MNRLFSAIALAGVMYAGLPALAVDTVRQSTLDQRQVRSCMGKRMSSDRTVSYNEAKKDCAMRLRAQNQSPTAPLAAAGAGGGK
jgi:BarA-like signal transduction histidine kinase